MAHMDMFFGDMEGVENEVSYIDSLPEHLLVEILKRLEPFETQKKQNFRSMTRVSKAWYKTANLTRTSLVISGFKACRMQRILTRFKEISCLHLGFLFDCTDDVLGLVGQLCPHLKDIQIPDSYKPNDNGSGLVSISKGCPNLETLSMHGYKGPEQALIALAQGCRKLKHLRLRSGKTTDAVMVELGKYCGHIEELDISFNEITDEALRAVGAGMRHLKKLDLKHCKLISGEGISFVAAGCPVLQTLHLGVVEVGDEGLSAIGMHSKRLEELYLDYGWGKWGKLSRNSVASVARGCPSLRILSLRGSKQVNDEVLQGLARGCPSLTELDLHACEQVADDGLRSVIKGCKKLKNLVLSGTGIGATSGDLFKGQLPHLTTLRLNGDLITDSVLKSVAENCKELAELYLVSCNISDEGLEHLLKGCKLLKILSIKSSARVTSTGFSSSLAPTMESLCLSGCGTTDEGLLAVAVSCGQLQHLSIPGCRKVTAAGLINIVKRCTTLKELIMVGCLQVTREEVLAIAKASRHTLKTMRVSRPDSPEDEYSIKRAHGGWNFPNWARISPSSSCP